MATPQDIITQVANELGVPVQLALAIAQQESGLNPTAVGDNGTSFGLYQLHQGGELGSMSPQQAFDPYTNAKTALSVVASVYRQHPDWSYGQIAAAAQRPADQAGYAASVNSIVGSGTYGAVARTAYTSSSGTNGTMTNPVTPGATPAPVIDFNTISSDFASVAGLLDAVPELKAWAQNIVNKQIQVDTPAGKAQAEQMLEQTNWWKTTSNAQRTYQQLKITNPGEAAAQVGAARSAIQAQAAAMGVTLNPSDLNTWALRKAGFGWTDQQIQAGLANYLKASDPTKLSGQGGADVNSIQKLAASYGITPTNYQLAAWTSEIAGGSQTVGGLQNYMMMQAKLIYPGLAKQIDQGMTVAQVAGAYQTEMGNVLELDPNTLDFTKDPLLKQALQYNPGLTKQGAVTAASQKATGATTAAATPETMPLYQFDQLLKNDPRWLQTDNAKSSALSSLENIGKAWGFSS